MRVEEVALLDVVESAAAILQASWQPPCLDYSTDYIRWQFSYPGDPGAAGVAAVASGEPIGFAAVVPRTVAFEGKRHPMLLLSFVSVRPGYRGQGVGKALYAALTAIAKKTGVPILSFAEVGTAGQRLLVESIRLAGYCHRNLGPCLCHAGIANDRENHHPEWTPCDPDQFSDLLLSLSDHALLSSSPDQKQCEHELLDPRGRELLIARGESGRAVGAARLVMARFLSPDGRREEVPMIDSLALADPEAESLRGLLTYCARWCAEDGVPRTVLLPNPSCISATTLRGSGFRAQRSRFEAHVFSPVRESPLLDAIETNFEIV
jgi:GNAT superfamily N-acetyltransferase